MIKVYSVFRNNFFKYTIFPRMNANTNRAPIGVTCIQKLCSFVCPRLRINRLLCYQSSVLVLTYFTYLTYHLSRKPISVVKNVLHQNCSTLEPPPDVDPGDTEWCNWAPFNVESDANALLGLLDSAFLFSYAGAMFLSGFIAERVDLRYFLALGMILSGIFSYGFGIAKTYNIHSLEYFLFMQAGAGIAQTTGWPGTVAVVGNWFGRSKKGLIFGIWNSHTSFGNILGALIASRYLNTDWALSMIYPGLVIAVMGFVVFLFLAPEPAAVGIHMEEIAAASNTPPRHIRRSDYDEESSPSHVIVGDQAASLRAARYSSNASPESYMTARHQPSPADATETTSLLAGEEGRERSCDAISLSHALAVPGVVEFGLSLFFAKLVSYTFLYWLPRYIKASTTFSPTDAGKLSTLFDVGGIVGGIMTGALADYSEAPAIICVTFYIMSAPMLFLYQAYGSVDLTWNIVLLLVMGLLVNGPYALITTAVSAELGTHRSLANNSKALATITAIIDGTGSIGAAIGPMLAAIVSQHSWSDVFYMLIACNFMAMFFLMRIVKTELGRFRHRNRAATRIE